MPVLSMWLMKMDAVLTQRRIASGWRRMSRTYRPRARSASEAPTDRMITSGARLSPHATHMSGRSMLSAALPKAPHERGGSPVHWPRGAQSRATKAATSVGVSTRRALPARWR